MAETETVLLGRFVRSGDAEAFAEIIRRYAGLVYSAALRVLADVDRASDIAQETFLQLAKDAGNVTGSLPGWLHRVATHKAIDQVRRDATRKHRENEYMAGRPHETAEWREISPYVDEGLNLLDPQLRNILISHFLEGHSTREIARMQGTSQATISRRIEAGVEQLRAGLRRRGILVAAATLGVLLGNHAVQAAPPLLLTELGKIALISGSLAASATAAGTASGVTATATAALTAVKANLAAVTAAAVVVLGAGSILLYQQMKSRQAPPEPAVVSDNAVVTDLASDLQRGPSADVNLQGAGNTGDRMVADTQFVGPSRFVLPDPLSQGLPGPEAETDPRTYVPGGTAVVSSDIDAATVPATSSLQAEAPDQPAPLIETGSPAIVSGGASRPATPQPRESPYEMVMRLRREAANKTQAFGEVDSQTAVTLGPTVARAELKLVPPFQGSPAGILGLQRQDTTTAKPVAMKEPPPAGAPREPVYFVVQAGDRQVQGIAYRSVRPSGEVMLLLDTDGDGLWSDERGYIGRRLWVFSINAVYEFGPVFLKQGSTQPGGDAFYAQCSDGKWLTFWPAFYRDGSVVLDGKTYRIALMDSDFDGRFDESFVPPAVGSRDPGCDLLAIDLNGDGEFIRRNASEELEIMPLSKLIRLGGRYYGLDVAEDGGTIEFRQAQPRLGTLDLGGKQVELELWSDAGHQRLSGFGGTWRLPAGRYGVVSLNLTETDAGNRWAFEMFRSEAGQLKDFEITPGRTTSFRIGPPFQIRTSMERFSGNPNVTVGFELQGQAGELYSGAPKKNGKEPPEPSFRIHNAAGQTAQSGRFAYS